MKKDLLWSHSNDKGHSGQEFNEMADRLAKEVLGIQYIHCLGKLCIIFSDIYIEKGRFANRKMKLFP